MEWWGATSHPLSPLHHSSTPPPYFFPCFSPLHHSITPSLHHSITPPLHHSITPPPYFLACFSTASFISFRWTSAEGVSVTCWIVPSGPMRKLARRAMLFPGSRRTP